MSEALLEALRRVPPVDIDVSGPGPAMAGARIDSGEHKSPHGSCWFPSASPSPSPLPPRMSQFSPSPSPPPRDDYDDYYPSSVR